MPLPCLGSYPIRMRPFVAFLLLAATTPLACTDDADGPTETSTANVPPATESSTDSTADGTATTSGTTDTTGAPLPDPGQQGDPCACEGDDPNACDAAQSNCGAELSCIAGSCRQACESLDDPRCPAGTTCIGVEIGGEALGFWCS